MQTSIATRATATATDEEARAILRRCVHCGFCNATCPTYQVLGDERDSPRGRIYLIKQMLEGGAASHATQTHLDRCLTCRNCETSCPSGVQFGQLLDIGREVAEATVQRPLKQRLQRAALRHGINSALFAPAVRLAQALRVLLPAAWRASLRPRHGGRPLPHYATHARQVLLLAGCVQTVTMPAIDAATVRVLDSLGIGARMARGSGCCGAVNFHLGGQAAARRQMRANIDAWWPLLESGAVESIVVNASGCGATLKEYPHHLRGEPDYFARAEAIAARVCDVAEIVAPHAHTLRPRLGASVRAAFHPPCTLQHWQSLRPLTENMLQALGFDLLPFAEQHLCCGSAGAYALLQGEIARTLRDRKLAAVAAAAPDLVLSSNAGCIGHLQHGTRLPVRHWIEALDDRMVVAASTPPGGAGHG